jgi:TRAP-type mannitol/chloroaromatic compound transport system permease large subunit
MVLLIMTGALAFSQILSFTGASQGLVEAAINLPIAPIFVVILMLIVILFLGMFMDVVAIMMITLPLFIPIITALGYEPVWFGAMYLLNIEMATTSPPFGLSLFVMKGVAPSDTTMGDIYLGALPFLSCDAVAMILMLVFPNIVLWLPGLMKTF